MASSRRKNPGPRRTIVSTSGSGWRDARLHLHLPMWVVALLAAVVVLTLTAYAISPQFAAAITLAFWELLKRISPNA